MGKKKLKRKKAVKAADLLLEEGGLRLIDRDRLTNTRLMKTYWLYLFYKEEDHQTSSSIHSLTTSLFNSGCESLGLKILEWKSLEAFKPKIQYNINTPQQCCLTNKYGQSIVRLSVVDDISKIKTLLLKLGYRDISEKL
jgi:hypothetical protein